MNKGNWNGKQLLPASYFDQYMRPQLPQDLPFSKGPDLFGKLPNDQIPEDYLAVRSFGGGSNHFSYGPGIYGFHWYFNTSGTVGLLKAKDRRVDPRAGQSFEQIWPGLPANLTMSCGWGINTVLVPDKRLVLSCGGNGHWGRPYLGSREPKNYKLMKRLVESVGGTSEPSGP